MSQGGRRGRSIGRGGTFNQGPILGAELDIEEALTRSGEVGEEPQAKPAEARDWEVKKGPDPGLLWATFCTVFSFRKV